MALTDSVDLSGLKDLHSLDIVTLRSMEDAFDRIVPVIATLTSNKLRNLTISFYESLEWRPLISSDAVGHPLDDAILALGEPSVVVLIDRLYHNNVAHYSKMFQRYFPRLHEGKLLQVQCSSGAYTMCMPLFLPSVAHMCSRMS